MRNGCEGSGNPNNRVCQDYCRCSQMFNKIMRGLTAKAWDTNGSVGLEPVNYLYVGMDGRLKGRITNLSLSFVQIDTISVPFVAITFLLQQPSVCISLYMQLYALPSSLPISPSIPQLSLPPLNP